MNVPGERGRFSGNRRGPCLDQSKSLVKSSLEEHVFLIGLPFADLLQMRG